MLRGVVGRGGSLVGAGDRVVPWGGDAMCQDGIGTMVYDIFDSLA